MPVFSLVDSDGNSILTGGRLGLLLYDDGTVCDDRFSSESGLAICRQMGFTGLAQWTNGNLIPDIQNNKDIKLDNVDCNSGDWESCTYSTTHNCAHSEDIFLSCLGNIDATQTAPPPVPTFGTAPPPVPTTTAPTSAPTSAPTTAPETPPAFTCPPPTTCPVCPEIMCPPGYYASQESTCLECPANTFSQSVGATSCNACPEASTSPTGSSACTCESGKIWNNTTSTCGNCPLNSAGKDGMCFECPEDSVAPPVDHQRACSCPVGKHWIWEANLTGRCVPCDENAYKGRGMTQCQACPDGSSSTAGSSVCSCEAGKYWDGQSCEQCTSGTASDTGALKCLICIIGTTESQDGCVCEDGMIWKWNDHGSGSCHPCLQNTFRADTMPHCSACPVGSRSFPGSRYCACSKENYWDGQNCKPCTRHSDEIKGPFNSNGPFFDQECEPELDQGLNEFMTKD